MAVILNYFINVIASFLLQLLWLLGPIFLFGFLISIVNKRFYMFAGKSKMAICYVTGCIGTPIHELSHAIMCVIFGHKIHKMQLFVIGSEDGTLGYVQHSYDKTNMYHRIGNFFIGVAPIIMGSLVLIFLMGLFAPNMQWEIFFEAHSLTVDFELAHFVTIFNMFAIFFSYANEPLWWGYLLIGIAISLHMNLSKADIKGSKTGFLAVLGLFGIFNIILGFFSTLQNTITSGIIFAGMLLILILILSLLFSLIMLAIAGLVRAIINLCSNKKYKYKRRR